MQKSVFFLVIVLTVVLTGCGGLLKSLRPEPEPALSPEEVLVAARAGDAQAAFWAYQQAETKADRRKWVCIAANRDVPKAQVEIARLHWGGAGIFGGLFERDAFISYVWSIIAISRAQPLQRNEERLALVLDEGEQQRAIQLAMAWQPDPAQCEDMERSEYFKVPDVTKSAQ